MTDSTQPTDLQSTPTTDAECEKQGLGTSIKAELVGAHFARTLERELNAAKAEVDLLHKQHEELKVVAGRLVEALTENVWPTATGTQESFNKAKEALQLAKQAGLVPNRDTTP